MRHPIGHIRQSDHATKLKWLIGLSITATIIIVAVWVLYMRAFVFTGSGPDTKEDVQVGMWPVFKNGLTITRSSISKAFDGMFSGSMPNFGKKTTTIENPN